MTEQPAKSSKSTPSNPRQQPPSPDDTLKVKHGERLLSEISSTQATVAATKLDTTTILEILNPPEEEESPILTLLTEILTTLAAHSEQLDRMENRLFDMDRRLGQLAQRFK